MDNNRFKQEPDQELLTRFQNTRDNFWMGVLLERHTLFLFGVAMKYLKNRELAEDAVQHTYLQALTRLPEGKIQSFKAWIYTVIRNYSLNQLVQNHSSNASILDDIFSLNDQSFQEKMDRERLLECLESGIDQLSDHQKKVIHAFYYQQQTYNDISIELGFTTLQVKTYLQNAKRNLKIFIEKQMKCS